MTPPRKKLGTPDSSKASSRLESLLTDLRSRDGQVRQKARESLTLIGKRAVPHLLPLLRDKKVDVRWEAAKALTEIPDARAASELVLTLADSNIDVRWLAAAGLIAIGRGALAPLFEALAKRSGSVRLRKGAHHVLHDLAKTRLKKLVAPVLAALDEGNAGFAVQGPVRSALPELKG